MISDQYHKKHLRCSLDNVENTLLYVNIKLHTEKPEPGSGFKPRTFLLSSKSANCKHRPVCVEFVCSPSVCVGSCHVLPQDKDVQLVGLGWLVILSQWNQKPCRETEKHHRTVRNRLFTLTCDIWRTQFSDSKLENIRYVILLMSSWLTSICPPKLLTYLLSLEGLWSTPVHSVLFLVFVLSSALYSR